MPISVLKPQEIVNIQNFLPNDVTYLQDSPSLVDDKNLEVEYVNLTTTPIVDFKFEIIGKLIGTQTINLNYTDNNWIGLHIEVLENGVRKYLSPTVYTGYGNLVTTFNFESTILDDPKGENLIIRVVGHWYNGLSINYLSAIELVSNYEISIYSILYNLKINWKPTDFYNFQDLNRVNELIISLNDQLPFFYGKKIDLIPYDISDMKSIIYNSTLNDIEQNLFNLRSFMNYPPGTEEPKTYWQPNDNFSSIDANRFERNIYYLWQHFEGNAQTIPYCGMYTVGQEEVTLHGL